MEVGGWVQAHSGKKRIRKPSQNSPIGTGTDILG